MTYRPTVRFDESYKDYVDQLFHSTRLTRNQIHRLSLFLLGFTKEGKEILEQYLKPAHELPKPSWDIEDHSAWKEREWVHKEVKDVSQEKANVITLKETGGITFKIG